MGNNFPGGGTVRVILETDLGVKLDTFPDRRDTPAREEIGWYPEAGWVWLSGLNPWDASEHFARHLRVGPCPVCRDGPLRRCAYCLGCDRTGLDGKRAFPGLAVDSAANPDWAGDDRPAFRPDPALSGGKGLKARVKARAGRG